MLNRILRLFRNFVAETRGAIAMQFAAMAIVLTFVAGFAVDYSMSRSADERIQEAADSAVLAAVDNLASNTGVGDSALQAGAEAKLKTYFNAAIAQYPSYHVTYTTNVTAHNGHVVAAMTYSASTTTTFSNLIGVKTINLAGSASAESAQAVYVAIYALLDASGSMGIGATQADQNIMQNAFGCTLACHISGTQITAHNAKAVLRFDVVKGALSSIIKASGAKAIMTNQFSFAVSKFSNDITEISPLSSDATKVAAAVDSMDLDDRNYGAVQGMGTNFATSLASFLKTIKTVGDGSSPSSPLVYVLIMTDGVSDDVFERLDANGKATGNWVADPQWDWFPTVYGGGEKFAGFNPALCDPFKKAGIGVMTLDMQYVIPVSPPGQTLDARYTLIENNLKPKILANLQKCASQASYAYAADSPGDIQSAINSMFETAIKSAHLSS